MLTKEEIQDIKYYWKRDPIYDLHNTDIEGITPAQQKELSDYQVQCEKEWEELRHKRLIDKSIEIGLPENIALAKYCEKLEMRIYQLEERFSKQFDED